MRTLTSDLENRIMSGRYKPAFKLYAYLSSNSISQVVVGTATAPLDLTPYVTSISWSLDSIEVSMVDSDELFHPDWGASAAYLWNGATIRLVEGDSRVAEAKWVNTFTGTITGQVGWEKSRSASKMLVNFTAYSRENNQAYKRRSITTKSYTVGTDIGVMFTDICDNILGFLPGERRLPSQFGTYFKHKKNQISQEAPWDAMSALLEVGCQVPFFDGDGRLAAYSKDVSRIPDLKLGNWARVVENKVPEQVKDNVNYVEVKYLNSELEEVEGEAQSLGKASVTTGFFTFEEKIKCYWSEDRRQRAKNTYMKTIKSVNSNLLPVGTESYEEIDEFHGVITISISVWVPLLATAMLAAYVALAHEPDETESTSRNITPVPISVPSLGTALVADPTSHIVTGNITINPASITVEEVPGTGWTIPWGRVAQATSLIGILAIMMSLGSAQYEIWGTPYDMVYKEKRVVAIEDGISYWQEKQKTIENDFIGTDERAEVIAVTELVYEHCLASPRELITLNHPGIEIGDIIQLPNEERFFVTGLSKELTLGEPINLTISGFKVTGA